MGLDKAMGCTGWKQGARGPAGWAGMTGAGGAQLGTPAPFMPQSVLWDPAPRAQERWQDILWGFYLTDEETGKGLRGPPTPAQQWKGPRGPRHGAPGQTLGAP